MQRRLRIVVLLVCLAPLSARMQSGASLTVHNVAMPVGIAGNPTLGEPSSESSAAAISLTRLAGGRAATEPVSQSGQRAGTAGVSPTLLEGSCNTAVGIFSLFNATAVHCFNAAVGYAALYSNVTGIRNTAIGGNALYGNSAGSENTATGFQALYANEGSSNTANGAHALRFNTGGYFNTATGYAALRDNTFAAYNTANGGYALGSNTTGHENTASGMYALTANTIGYYNTADGVAALGANTTGFNNTGIGLWALLANTEGSNNTAVGFNAGANATTGTFNVYLGAQVTGTASDTNTIRIGLPFDGTGGQNQTFIAGIYETAIAGGVPVVIDANGQLGVQALPGTGGVTPAAAPAAGSVGMDPLVTELQRQVEEQQAINARQQAMIADLLARLTRLEARGKR